MSRDYSVVLETHLPGVPCRRGKVRDVYDLGQELLLVSTDRISAFDWVLPTGIPDKGRVLTAALRLLVRLARRAQPPHRDRVSAQARLAAREPTREFAGRSMRVRKTSVVPIECVVRGYLAGSGWKEYRQSGAVCGSLAAGRLARERPVAGADLHSRHQGGERARHEHFVRAEMQRLVGAGLGGRAARIAA